MGPDFQSKSKRQIKMEKRQEGTGAKIKYTRR